MLRTIALSAVITSGPILYFAHPHSAITLCASMLLSILLPMVLILLIRHTRKRAQHRTIAMLARGGDTLDMIIAEAERRAGRTSSPPARSKK